MQCKIICQSMNEILSFLCAAVVHSTDMLYLIAIGKKCGCAHSYLLSISFFIFVLNLQTNLCIHFVIICAITQLIQNSYIQVCVCVRDLSVKWYTWYMHFCSHFNWNLAAQKIWIKWIFNRVCVRMFLCSTFFSRNNTRTIKMVQW